MYGREQPYLHSNATGTYVKTPWVDDVPGIQEEHRRMNSISTTSRMAWIMGISWESSWRK